nr:hypothetical protein BaRGS_020184 [Batillaria attramentaria]
MTSGVFPASPAFVYSRRRLEENVQQYQKALHVLPVPSSLYYSMKANHNLQILNILRSMGCGLTLVSGGELQIALALGFEASRLLLNGSGKVRWEVEAAVRADVLLNVDSEFDLQQTVDVCRQLGRPARALLRLNLDIDPKVHKYVSTGQAGSKFGLDPAALARVVGVLTSGDCPVHVEGLHCHLGSTIRDADVLRESVRRLLTIRQELTSQGLHGLRMINIGGGLNIDYTRQQDETKPYRVEEEECRHDLTRLAEDLGRAAADEPEERRQLCLSALDMVQDYCKERISRATLDCQVMDVLNQLWPNGALQDTFAALLMKKQGVPTPKELIESIAGLFESPRDDDVTIIVEPGRTIVGDAAVFLTTVLGRKSSGSKNFLVVDGAMTDVVRPSLYGAYHHIHPAAPPSSKHAQPLTSTADPPSGLGDASHEAGRDTSRSSGQGEGRGQSDLQVVDVVGPVCESGDFLGKDRLLPLLSPGACVVVRDVGAYCASMASNYNVRMRPVEVMVDGTSWRVIRRPDTVADVMRPYQVDTDVITSD